MEIVDGRRRTEFSCFLTTESSHDRRYRISSSLTILRQQKSVNRPYRIPILPENSSIIHGRQPIIDRLSTGLDDGTELRGHLTVNTMGNRTSPTQLWYYISLGIAVPTSMQTTTATIGN